MSHDTSTHFEEWRDVPGYEDYYKVSNHGRVRSLDRWIPTAKTIRFYSGGIIAPSALSDGHLKVRLYKDGSKKNHKIHRLVLRAFDREPRDGEVCRHLDGNPENNHIDNLVWGTQSENNYDQTRHGTNQSALKTKCPRGHLLVRPNLRPSALEKGRRTCLACDRASAYARKYGLKDQLQQLSDEKYLQIMNG
ncbi:NUMOD4 domain-containing protein [Corynebacterium glutamicum]|uniref:NUMOD4 domain-containing protein n=1 Tax=Corynebacterium glutamicum TaxID=1718 RepID=UPI0005C6759C